MTSENFIQRVLSLMNETDSDISGAEFIGSDAANLRHYITSLYPVAWRRAITIFPANWFPLAEIEINTETHKTFPTNGTGYILLPEDYFKLSCLNLKGWQQPCLLAIPENAIVNAQQANEITRGNPVRPVCVERYRTVHHQLRKTLWYYSLPCTSDDGPAHEITEATYIRNTQQLTDDSLTTLLAEPLAILTASTVLTSLEKTDAATRAENLLKTIIPS